MIDSAGIVFKIHHYLILPLSTVDNASNVKALKKATQFLNNTLNKNMNAFGTHKYKQLTHPNYKFQY